jgi:hypothetical protein
MARTPEQIKLAEEKIVEVILHGIDPCATYLVCNDSVTEYVTERVTKNLPISVVHTSGQLMSSPPRDFGIYRLNGPLDLPSHNSMEEGFAGHMVEREIGVLKLGGDITVTELSACAKMEVFLRLSAEMEPG